MSTPHIHVDPARRAGKPFTLILTILVPTLVAFLAAAPVHVQTTRHVDGINGNDQDGANDCTDETAPCQTISHAISVSFGGDVIDIADAVYTETLGVPRSLTLQGESEEGTIIQAHTQPGQATSRVITIDGDFEVEITDLTIRHGNAAGDAPNSRGGGIYINSATVSLANVTFYENEASGNGGGVHNRGSASLANVTFTRNRVEGNGGGIYNFYSDATLTNVTFEYNLGSRGGGMDNFGGGPYILTGVSFIRNRAERGGGMANRDWSSPMLTNVTFYNNRATSSSGGGMYNIHDSSPTLENVLFEANHAAGTEQNQGGGGMYSSGDSDSSPTLTNVRFIENTAVRGGGMRISGGVATLRNVRFIENEAEIHGGGVYVEGFGDDTANFLNAIFYDNHALDGHGGAMFNDSDTDVAIINVAVSGNSAAGHGGGVFNGSEEASLFNAIVWGNTAGGADEIFTSTDANTHVQFSLYSDEPGDIGGSGEFQVDENSLTMDPLFLEPQNGNLRLTEGSPAIDAGFGSTPPAWFPTDDNGDPIDLLGNPRFFGVIDMGAYEWNPNVADEAGPNDAADVLGAPYPNPASALTSLSLNVAETQNVIVEVFDALGRRVQTLYDGALPTGTTETLTLDASALPAGVYIVRAQGEDFARTRRVTVVR